MRKSTARFVPLALFAAITAVSGGAQAPADPYSRGEPAALARVGYTRLGSMPFGTGHNSRDIEALLPGEQLLWIKTAHFRIGCALPPADLGVDLRRRNLQAELVELAGLLPRVDAKARRLDRWLRVHLVAWRAERLYAAVQGLPGCTSLLLSDVVQVAFPVAGRVETAIGVPHAVAFLGLQLRQQVAPLEINTQGVVTAITATNGLLLTIGML
jgi:hypothetical protein